jgi:hypothetical protein
MTPQQFIAKWKPVALTERATAQSHFLDLCALLGHDDPVTADPIGEWFTFEKGVTKTGGGDGCRAARSRRCGGTMRTVCGLPLESPWSRFGTMLSHCP